jgi:hypothetical protein
LAGIELLHVIRKGQFLMMGCEGMSFADQFYTLAGQVLRLYQVTTRDYSADNGRGSNTSANLLDADSNVVELRTRFNA